jgi:hypothetical protein
MGKSTMLNRRPLRLRTAELISATGARVLGVGLGAGLAERLTGLGLPLLVAGLSQLGDVKHPLEHLTGAVDLWWQRALYWVCWALLGLITLLGVVALTQRLPKATAGVFTFPPSNWKGWWAHKDSNLGPAD